MAEIAPIASDAVPGLAYADEANQPALSGFRCDRCGYGASCRSAPERCPMCGGSDWRLERRPSFSRDADTALWRDPEC